MARTSSPDDHASALAATPTDPELFSLDEMLTLLEPPSASPHDLLLLADLDMDAAADITELLSSLERDSRRTSADNVVDGVVDNVVDSSMSITDVHSPSKRRRLANATSDASAATTDSDTGAVLTASCTSPSASTSRAIKTKKTYVRRDPRKEIAALRVQTTHLHEQLALLQRRAASVSAVTRMQQLALCATPLNTSHSHHSSKSSSSAQAIAERELLAPPLTWVQRAFVALQHRERAEQTNAALRAALVKQLRRSRVLQTLLHDAGDDEDGDGDSDDRSAVRTLKRADLDDERTPSATLSSTNDSSSSSSTTTSRVEKIADTMTPSNREPSVAELSQYLEALYYSTNLVVDKIRSSSSSSVNALTSSSNGTSSVSSRHSQDAALGSVVELVASTSVRCEFRALEALVWHRIVSNTMTRECQRFESKHKQRALHTSDCVEKHVHLSLDGRAVTPLTLRGISLTRRFVEPRRTVLVFTMRTRCSERDVALREDSWLVLTDTSSDSSSSGNRSSSASVAPVATRFEMYHRVHAEQASGSSGPTPQLRELQDWVVRAVGERVEEHHLLAQQVLRDEFGACALAADSLARGSCPQRPLAAV